MKNKNIRWKTGPLAKIGKRDSRMKLGIGVVEGSRNDGIFLNFLQPKTDRNHPFLRLYLPMFFVVLKRNLSDFCSFDEGSYVIILCTTNHSSPSKLAQNFAKNSSNFTPREEKANIISYLKTIAIWEKSHFLSKHCLMPKINLIIKLF